MNKRAAARRAKGLAARVLFNSIGGAFEPCCPRHLDDDTGEVDGTEGCPDCSRVYDAYQELVDWLFERSEPRS